MRWWAMLALVTGCYRPSEIASCNVACGPNRECPSGMRCGADNRCTGESEDCNILHPDAPDMDGDGHTSSCWGGNGAARLGMLCPPGMPPTSPLVINSNMTIDTTTCKVGAEDGITIGVKGVDACLLSATLISIGSGVTVIGSKPLVMLATDELTLSAGVRLSLAGGRATQAAPGAGACTNSGPGFPSDFNAGGGAGGSYGTYGSAGGLGRSSFSGDASAGHTNQPLFGGDVLAGGCDGTDGGAGSGTLGSTAGGGGGAIWIVAGTKITIAGTINASGQGGRGGIATFTNTGTHAAGGGGGGGGAGGLVALDAPMLIVGGIILANGGGGGGGAGEFDMANNVNAEDGHDPDPSAPVMVASGGSPTAIGTPGYGGAGAAGSAPAGPGSEGAGAGGGGGGLGIIELLCPAATTNVAGAVFSPNPS